MKRLATTVIAVLGSALACAAQSSLLTIEIDNYVPYHYDVFDHGKFATAPVFTPQAFSGHAFDFFVFVGDIVAVNGKPAKGLWTARVTAFFFEPNAAPGHSIADVTRSNVIDMYWEITQLDGTPIGTLAASGLTQGSPPPGAPSAQTGDNLIVVGGTGAFLGARGQAGGVGINRSAVQQASVVEDPANRRIIGGANRTYVLHLLPMTTPEIFSPSTGPAIVHSSDNSPVTAAKPAHPGEMLTLYATGLGPTRPGVDPGKPFSADGPQVVNSPVQVMVSGTPAPATYAGGYPGAVNGYQVNFRLPDNTASGLASLSLNVAWINGSEVKIPVAGGSD